MVRGGSPGVAGMTKPSLGFWGQLARRGHWDIKQATAAGRWRGGEGGEGGEGGKWKVEKMTKGTGGREREREREREGLGGITRVQWMNQSAVDGDSFRASLREEEINIKFKTPQMSLSPLNVAG